VDVRPGSRQRLWRRRVATFCRGARVRWTQEWRPAPGAVARESNPSTVRDHEVEWVGADGDAVVPDQLLAPISGKTRSHDVEVVLTDRAGQRVDDGRVLPARRDVFASCRPSPRVNGASRGADRCTPAPRRAGERLSANRPQFPARGVGLGRLLRRGTAAGRRGEELPRRRRCGRLRTAPQRD
jgi:hypothetical protein